MTSRCFFTLAVLALATLCHAQNNLFSLPSPLQMVTDTTNGSGRPYFAENMPHIVAGSNLVVWVGWNQLYADGVIFVSSKTGATTVNFTNVSNNCDAVTNSCQSLFVLNNALPGTATVTVQFNIIGTGVTYQMMAEEIPGP